MSTFLHVDHAALEGATLDLRRTVAELDQRLERLDAELAPLRSDWTGEAQQSYVAAKATWDRALREMRDLLAETQVSVGQSMLDYQAADRRGAAQFGG